MSSATDHPDRQGRASKAASPWEETKEAALELMIAAFDAWELAGFQEQ